MRRIVPVRSCHGRWDGFFATHQALASISTKVKPKNMNTKREVTQSSGFRTERLGLLMPVASTPIPVGAAWAGAGMIANLHFGLSALRGAAQLKTILATPPNVRHGVISVLPTACKRGPLDRPVGRSVREAQAVVEICGNAGGAGGVFQHRMCAPIILAVQHVASGALAPRQARRICGRVSGRAVADADPARQCWPSGAQGTGCAASCQSAWRSAAVS